MTDGGQPGVITVARSGAMTTIDEATDRCFASQSLAQFRRRLIAMKPGESFVITRQRCRIHVVAKELGLPIVTKKLSKASWQVTKLAIPAGSWAC